MSNQKNIIEFMLTVILGILLGILFIIGLDKEIAHNNLELQSFRDAGYPLSLSQGEGSIEQSAHNNNQ
jgi:hypothetical protein